MRFFYILPSNIVNIDNRCQYRLLSESNSPPPPRLFPFRATFARCDLTLGSSDCFLPFVVMKVLNEVTACIYEGEEKPVMKWSFLTRVENKDLKSFLQALIAFGVDQRAKELGIQDYKLKLQCKRLTPEPENFPVDEFL